MPACSFLGDFMEIGYKFKNEKLLRQAFTHISYANERNVPSNQRLEFLGDSVLSFVVAEKLYQVYPKADEGVLTEMRAALVCEKSLAQKAKIMGLGDGLIFGRSENRGQGKEKASILCDTFEALLGAIFEDGGISKAKEWILKVFENDFENISTEDLHNYKSELQSYYQQKEKRRGIIEYKLTKRTGPDHSPSFWVSVFVDGEKQGDGKGPNLKTAQQCAAREALLRAQGEKR